jgi:hypothetical protein
VFEEICAMTWCHQSQIMEWLPWVGRHRMSPPASFDEWRQMLRRRFGRVSRDLGISSSHAVEVFTATAWGEIPTCERLQADFPNLLSEACHWDALRSRLDRWRGTE